LVVIVAVGIVAPYTQYHTLHRCKDRTDMLCRAIRTDILHFLARVVGIGISSKAPALFRLALALLRSSGFMLTHERLPDGRAKARILRAVDRARPCAVAGAPAFLRLSPSRFQLGEGCSTRVRSVSCGHVALYTSTFWRRPINSSRDNL
jgi:hypothetical protein